MLIAVIAAVLLVVATTTLHLTTLRWLSGQTAAIPMRPTTRVLVIVLVMFAAHLGEVALYALAYGLGDQVLAIGSFGGVPTREPLDYFYFSVVSFTSLGIGEVFPHGHLRFLTGVEALNGLLLIAWSASFLFAAMCRLWEWQPFATLKDKETPDRAD